MLAYSYLILNFLDSIRRKGWSSPYLPSIHQSLAIIRHKAEGCQLKDSETESNIHVINLLCIGRLEGLLYSVPSF